MPATSSDVTPIQIDNQSISSAEFCSALRQHDLNQYSLLVDHVVNHFLVLNACNRLGITATDAELQANADNMRLSQGLASAADTLSWLNYKNLSPEDFEKNIEFWTLAPKLIEKECGPTAKHDRFAANRHAFSEAAISVITVDSEGDAQSCLNSLNGSAERFADVARQHSTDSRTGPAGGMLGWTGLSTLPAELRDPIAASSGNGEVLGPIEAAGAWNLVRVEAVSVPEYSDQYGPALFLGLLNEWLAEERKRVSIDYPSA